MYWRVCGSVKELFLSLAFRIASFQVFMICFAFSEGEEQQARKSGKV